MIALWLIACHMVGDYILQTPRMAALKLTNAKVRAQHVTTYTLFFILPLLVYRVPVAHSLLFLLAVWVTHFVTDSRRWASAEPWPPKPIMVDQAIHLLTLAILGTLLLP